MDPDKWFKEVKRTESTKSGYHCTVCKVTLPNYDGFMLHVKGKRHQKAVKLLMKDESVLPGENVTSFWCQICNIYCTNQEALDLHLQGKKHLKMLKHEGLLDETEGEDKKDKVKPGSSTSTLVHNPFAENVLESEPPKIRCTLCDVVLSSNVEMREHISTTEHYMSLRKAPGKRLKDILVPIK